MRRLILTASGGPFRDLSPAELEARAAPTPRCGIPTWQMGRKITIDSATLMNKGLEVIEAHWLFGVPADRIDVVIHPQSIVHSMVELTDGSVIAQLGVTDMRLPIQYACSVSRALGRGAAQAGPGAAPAGWSSSAPDQDRFPCLRLAYRALREGGTCAGGAERGQRGGRGVLSRGTAGVHGDSRGDRADDERPPRQSPSLQSDVVRRVDAWARDHARRRSAGELELTDLRAKSR